MIDILGELLGGAARVKLMRLFVFNPYQPFEVSDVTKRTGINTPIVNREIKSLLKSKFIKPKVFFKMVSKKEGKENTEIKKKVKGFVFNELFPFAAACQSMLLTSTSLSNNSIMRRFNRAGHIKLIIIAGIFLQEPESRLDLMIVGDRVNKRVIDRAVHSLEGEIGRELRYAVFETSDFNYRLSVYDRLVRDVLDYPHQKLLDKIG